MLVCAPTLVLGLSSPPGLFSKLAASFEPYETAIHPLQAIGLRDKHASTGCSLTDAPEALLPLGLDRHYPGARVVHLDPLVVVIDDFFTAAECDAYRRLSESPSSLELAQSGTFGGTRSIRTSTTWFVRYQDCPVLLAKAQALLGVPVSSLEEPQLVRYRPGQSYSECPFVLCCPHHRCPC